MTSIILVYSKEKIAVFDAEFELVEALLEAMAIGELLQAVDLQLLVSKV